ncbi:MAG TPA: 4Fe-4S dicluster domain-containing protein [Spirochaetia bacterium]|nr:4Fe-4S dicluster domain-containing protein [Spirochaetia bacterium]
MSKRPMDKRIIVRIERCMGCHSCELACALAHSSTKELISLMENGEKPGYRINVEAYGINSIPVNCQHCEEAGCLMVCPTGAIHRAGDRGPVLYDAERCIGCRMCIQACPFGVVTVSPEGKRVLKCDLCVERLAKHQEPACVVACPTQALVFADQEDGNRIKRRKVAAQLVAALESGAQEPGQGDS